MSSFSEQIWVVPHWIQIPKFLAIPTSFWVLGYDWSPLFFSQKSSDRSQAINNDRSLKFKDGRNSVLIFFPVKYLMYTLYVHIYSFLLLPVVHSRLFQILIFSAFFRSLQLFHQTEIRYLPFWMSVAVWHILLTISSAINISLNFEYLLDFFDFDI